MNPSYLDAVRSLGADPEYIERVLDHVAFGVFVDHVEKGCIYANREALRMFEMDWEAFRGYGWANAVLQEDMETLREAIERYEREKTTIDVQYRIRVPDGSTRALHVRGQAVLGAAGEHRGSLMIGREVTAEREESDRMLHAQKLEAIGRLSGRVAHDFNNVLTPILCSASLLEQEPISEVARECVNTILRCVDHAALITRQLLGLARQDVNERRIAVLDTEIEKSRPLLAQLLGEGVALTLDLQAPGVQIGMAPHELSQVVLNLAVNGRDAMAGRGALSVVTRLREDVVELAVRDAGTGVTEEVQRRMFEPFFTTKSADRGTGLGLSTVDALVRRTGGRILVQSTPGEGTEVTVTLPCLAKSEVDAVPLQAGMADEAPFTVLVVDDDSALRQTLAFVLALRGHRVKIAASVGKALQLTRRETFDVLVTDVLLPDGEGTQLVREVRHQRPDLRVIYMSGFAGDALATLDLDSTRTAFLQKPFHPNQLAAALAAVM